MKYFYIVAGTICVGLGILGIFLPLLPTTPLLLLAAYLHARSSQKLYEKLITNRYLGNYIRNFINKKVIPLKAKAYAISLLWASMLLCIILGNFAVAIDILLFCIAVLVSLHIASFRSE